MEFLFTIYLPDSVYISYFSQNIYLFFNSFDNSSYIFHNFDNSYCFICQYRYYPYVWYQPLQWQWWAHYCDYPLTLFRNFPEHLKVTTFLGANIIFPPVAGFRPFRSIFSLTRNLPKPLIMTSSPDARVCFII